MTATADIVEAFHQLTELLSLTEAGDEVINARENRLSQDTSYWCCNWSRKR